MPTELPTERAVRKPGSMELDPSGDGLAIDEERDAPAVRAAA